MDETGRSGGETARRWLRLVPTAIWGAGLVFLALAVGEARWWAGGFVLAGGLAHLLLRGADGNRPRSTAASRSRNQPHWPDASVKSVVEALREPGVVVDRSLALRFANAAASRAFGPLVLGDPIAMRFRAPDLLAALERAVESDEAEQEELNERLPADRSWGIDILPLRLAGEERPPFLLLLFRDHTQARRLERMRTDFVANASHELRTPLASLSGFIETLKGPARDDAAARMRFLDIMQEQARRMSRLIDDLLSLSRIETRRRLRSNEAADIADILRSVARQLGPQAAEGGLAVRLVGLDGDGVLVNGDRDELIQVFANLFENACKYGGDGGRVEIGLRRDGEGVEAYVRDFGKGIPAEHVPRLTERFYRVEEGTSGKPGTGLGLSIVRHVLTRHRTRLSIVSEPGKGSTFSVRFVRFLDAMEKH
ncbi:ATP-binding protein [Aureimonas sp. SK2]|uniref:ATP-binding protein n=1 Tax=Aureimonas sp. SK2 TaxID=3015992 RepID=UPI0024444B47|nr:ATP-binding protein [Aureimonas sp. SK2]